MKTISISALKARLSAQIRALADGQDIVVLDRDHPVAVLSAWEGAAEFKIRPPMHPFNIAEFERLCSGGKESQRLPDPLPLLLEERNAR